MASYRIEFSVQRCDDDSEEYTEIGFGSSGTWDDVDAAEHAMGSVVQNRQWETSGDMPEPESVDESEED
jgi:hypothetical protein